MVCIVSTESSTRMHEERTPKKVKALYDFVAGSEWEVDIHEGK